MDNLIIPFEELGPCECPRCGKTLKVIQVDSTIFNVNSNGTVYGIEDGITKTVGVCECGYSHNLVAIDGRFYIEYKPANQHLIDTLIKERKLAMEQSRQTQKTNPMVDR